MPIEKVTTLVNILKKKDFSEDELIKEINNYFEAINQTENSEEEKIIKSMEILSEVFDLENPNGTKIASKICGNLTENGLLTPKILDNHIQFLSEIIDEIQPFVNRCEEELKENLEELEEDIIEDLKIKLKSEFLEEINALNLLDDYYLGVIPTFAFNLETLKKAKQHFSDLNKLSDYSIGFYWISKLLNVLIDEPIIAIDLNTKKGILGKMNGISDNFQLQWLLMGLNELNETILISEEQLAIVKGTSSEQSLNESIIGKWDMCNWEYLKSAINSEENYNSKHWIWSEGTPSDISKFENYRVVLLDKPSYERSSQIQRMFNNLKAEVSIDKILSEDEVNDFLEKFKKAKL